MTMRVLGIVLASVTLSALAQIAFKFGVSAQPSTGAQRLLGPLAVVTTPGVAIGLFLYGVGTLLWLSALARTELSQLYPFVGIGFVLTALAGWGLFGDRLSWERLVGMALVAAGILLISRS